MKGLVCHFYAYTEITALRVMTSQHILLAGWKGDKSNLWDNMVCAVGTTNRDTATQIGTIYWLPPTDSLG